MKVSVIIPAKNEAASIGDVVKAVCAISEVDNVLVVDDGSTDDTAELARANGARVVSHPVSLGNGAAVKTGARNASGDVFVFMDADGQHQASDISGLLAKLVEGFDMVVGNRDSKSQASFGRLAANRVYNKLASWMTGHRVRDLTSGFRAVNAEKFKEFIYLLPNGFSYPTTSTMAFFRAGYPVHYMGITALKRTGSSHINIWRDGVRFLLIIFKVATLYSPLKVFFPLSLMFFISGLMYYAYTFFSDGRFTNMGVLLFVTSILIFLIGLMSEQVATLIYKK
jgi:glycosyltransferase involved in cell wall biosynthesis